MARTKEYNCLLERQDSASTAIEMENEEPIILLDSPPEYDLDYEKTTTYHKGTKRGMKTTTMSHALTHDAELLIQYVRWQQCPTPAPIIHIKGTHRREGCIDPVTDFDISIELQDYLNTQKGRLRLIPDSWNVYRGGRTKTDNLGRDLEACYPAKSWEEHCRDFVAYQGGPKK